MFTNLISSRAGLTASTALVAVGLVMVVPFDALRLPNAPATRTVDSAVAEPVVGEPAIEEAIVVEEFTILSEDAAQSADLSLSAPAPATLSRKAAGGIALRDEGPITLPEANTEAFANAPANPVHVTAETPVSTFSIDVDTASYSVIRRSLTGGMMPP